MKNAHSFSQVEFDICSSSLVTMKIEAVPFLLRCGYLCRLSRIVACTKFQYGQFPKTKYLQKVKLKIVTQSR